MAIGKICGTAALGCVDLRVRGRNGKFYTSDIVTITNEQEVVLWVKLSNGDILKDIVVNKTGVIEGKIVGGHDGFTTVSISSDDIAAIKIMSGGICLAQLVAS